MKSNAVSRAINAGGALMLMIGSMSITAAAEPAMLEARQPDLSVLVCALSWLWRWRIRSGWITGDHGTASEIQRREASVAEERTDLQPAFVKSVVRHGIQAMPFFRKTEISDPDLDAIAAYLARGAK